MADIYDMNEYRKIKGYQVRKGGRRNRKKKKSGCISWIISVLFLMCVGLSLVILLDRAGVMPQVADLNVKRVPFKAVNLVEDDLSGKYYYAQLNEEEQKAYKELVQGIKNCDVKIYVHMADGDRCLELLQYVLNDYPEFFWCSGQAQGTFYEGSVLQSGYTEVSPVYAYQLSEIDEKKAEIDEVANAIIAKVDADASEYDRVKYAFEYIVQHTDYDLNAPDNQNILSVFLNQKSVCAGYARAYQYLLERMGIPCIYVTGTAIAEGTEQAHAWNIVKINDKYYQVDVTWGDPVFQSSAEGVDNPGDYVYHDYLCCTDSFIETTHRVDKMVTMPVCDSNDCNYYQLNQCYYEEYNGPELLNVMKQGIEEKRSYMDFQFSTDEVYQQAKAGFTSNIMNAAGQYLASRYGLLRGKYAYQLDENTKRITIFWTYE